jgi:L-ascorbate metabolism protein UlaG (beta-lactamase superfamily)
MEITWLGHACFRVRAKEATVVCDPFNKSIGLALPRTQADIVTVSHEHLGHNAATGVGGNPRIISGPGEYEIKNCFITGIAAYHDAEQGKSHGKVTIYLIEMEDMVVCHLGDLGHVLTQAQIEAIGHVDVLLAPVGAGNSLNAAQAAEVIGLLEPRAVIPMHYQTTGLTTTLDPLTRFVKEMGARSDPQRNPLHPGLRLEEVEPGQPYMEITRSGDAPAPAPEPPVAWTCRLKKG